VLVTSWMKETQARRALAAAWLKKPARRRRMTEEEIMNLVAELGGIMQALKDADPADKAEIYRRKTSSSGSATEFDHVHRDVSEDRLHQKANTHCS
jgi:hypothetical protein